MKKKKPNDFWDLINAQIEELKKQGNLPPNWLIPPTFREEANVMTAFAFRNGYLEDLHAEGKPITDKEMKELMVDASSRLAVWLKQKDEYMKTDPQRYYLTLRLYEMLYTSEWDK